MLIAAVELHPSSYSFLCFHVVHLLFLVTLFIRIVLYQKEKIWNTLRKSTSKSTVELQQRHHKMKVFWPSNLKVNKKHNHLICVAEATPSTQKARKFNFKTSSQEMIRVRVQIIVLARTCLGLLKRGQIIMLLQISSKKILSLRREHRHLERTNLAWTSEYSRWATRWPSVRLLDQNISQLPKRKLKSLQ